MNKFMPQIWLKLTLFLVFSSFYGCQDETIKSQSTSPIDEPTFKQLRAGVKNDPLDSVRRFNIAHPSGRLIKTVLLYSVKEHEVGLSGTKDHEFDDNEGALFWYDAVGLRRFWMPDTYFNLDLVFLDSELRVIDVDKDLEAHPGREEPPAIKFSKSVRARHVLEIKSASDFASAIKVGDQLKVLSPLNLSQIESKIHQMR
ncbi:MAG: hypothetical protein CME71_05225 [Halobacteriovorax sp.]|nr:hypothetical protein [Halobacteriovorax sp.]